MCLSSTETIVLPYSCCNGVSLYSNVFVNILDTKFFVDEKWMVMDGFFLIVIIVYFKDKRAKPDK